MKVTFKQHKKLFLLDQDGTLYKGKHLFPYSVKFLEQIKASGAKYLFITNNSSKSTNEYVAKMNKFGIKANAEDFYTSSHATMDYIKLHHKGKKVFLVGTMALSGEFLENGINLTENIDEVEVAVLSYDTELNYEKLTALCHILAKPDVVYLATNPDLVCPTETGYLPDCGSFAILIYNATGRNPLFLGKPRKLFVETILQRFNLRPEDMVIVGDRLYTDIALGNNAGVDTILVLSGEASLKDLKDSPNKPTFVVENVGEIF